MKSYFLRAALTIGTAWLLLAPEVRSSTYWFAGVRSGQITVCFAGNASVVRPDRVAQVMQYVRQYEFAAQVRFVFINRAANCPASTSQSNGNDFFAGDVRILLPGVMLQNGQDVFSRVTVPGKGCTNTNDSNNLGGSWSNPPDDLDKTERRSCLYNMHLNDDGDPATGVPWLNHTLHEFGHALGFVHEHERADATCYDPNHDARHITGGYLTPYDVRSVMHYKFQISSGATCNTNGNYDNTGLTNWDKLGVHILYPENAMVAEFVGTSVVTSFSALRLRSAWGERGGNLSFDASQFVWKLNGQTVGTNADLNLTTPFGPGDYRLDYAYTDFLGRVYSYSGKVRILAPAEFNKDVAGPLAALLPLQ